MIIYSSSAIDFRRAVDNNEITMSIENAFKAKLGKKPNIAEVRSWNNSMQFMEKIIRNSNVADDCGILIEYNIPSTSKRVDFIISGKDESNNDNFVIVELKQWDKAEATDKDGIVKAFIGGRNREVTHPSYQAWSYRQYLTDMNEAIHTKEIKGHSCAYLHNYRETIPEPLKGKLYNEIVDETPLFFATDSSKFQQFLYKHVGQGNGVNLLYLIENGRIKPSKKLIDHIDSLFKGNSNFILLDEQKVAYETIVSLAKKQDAKRTIIIQGGPGTGKSVISMNAFGQLLRSKLNVKFVAPNASFRNVMVQYLGKHNAREITRIKGLFNGSGQFFDSPENFFDVLVVDEAHRLKRKGAFQYKGENQIEDIVNAARVSVFFIDDTQRIRPEDIGSVEEIKKIAKKYNSEIHEIKLNAQFRCSGAEGFINWVDDVLQIRETGNFNGWDKEQFEFKIFDTPNKVYQEIKDKVNDGYMARLLAGFAWNWTSEKEGNRNGEIADVIIEEHGFAMPWNGRAISTTWAVHQDGVNQIGCVHTSQGLEFDYVGIIIGNDLKYDNETMSLYADYDEYRDSVGKKGLKYKNNELTELVKNIYKILMSRGMKGCYVYCRDKDLQEYLKKRFSLT